jgi:hypothetical protein
MAAATRWRVGEAFWRASVVRARALAAEDAGVRAAFAASPRAAAAFEDAAREAALRFDAGRASTASGAVSGAFASAAGFAAARVVRGVFGVLALAALDLDELVFADWVLADPVVDALVRDAVVLDALVLAVGAVSAGAVSAGAVSAGAVSAGAVFAAGFRAAGFLTTGFVAAGSAAAPGSPADVPEAVRDERDRGDRGVVVPRVPGATTSPRSAGTPVPVPPGVSSSGPDRETEVTPTTYQPARAARWRTPPSARRTARLRTRTAGRKLGIASRSGYGFPLDSASTRALRYPETRHNGVSRSELADELPANSV